MPSFAIQAKYELALQHHRAGELREADALYREVLADEPDHVPCLQMLAVLAHQVGHDDTAARLLTRAVQLNPNDADLHNNLGVALAAAGRSAEAEAAYKQAIALRPEYAEAHNNLGTTLRDAGELDAAIAAYLRGIALRPNYAMAYRNLGLALQEKGETKKAISYFRQSIEIEPDQAEVHNHLAIALCESGELDQATPSARQALAQDPNSPAFLCTLATVLKEAAELDEAIGLLRRAMELSSDPAIGSSLLYLVHLHPDYDAKRIYEEHVRWNDKYVKPLTLESAGHHNDKRPDRRLRIGYISPDFREHSVGRFILPLLANHDHETFEILCFSDVRRPDNLTSVLAGYSDHWQDTASLNDQQLSELIRKSEIDVLVDLAMHTRGSRLMALARKPAPVQVAYLAYCSTTGLESIDYRLTDPYFDPPERFDAYYTERSIRLPETYWCFSPHPAAPNVSALPLLESGVVTFGCLNGFCKINDGVLSTWCELLRRVPHSRLILCARYGSHRAKAIQKMADQGIEASRIEFVPLQPPAEHFRQYHRIDVALDPFPYPGGTTTCDAMWMGVPVVTLPGGTAVSRAGLSILANIGLAELAADSRERYVQIAFDLAGDVERLRKLRSSLRDRMRSSALMNAPRFARNVEAAYRRMWLDWLRPTAENSAEPRSR